MTNSYTAGTLTVLLSDRHGNFAQLPGVHAGDAPKGGEVPSNLPDFLHRSKPMPNYGLTPTAALGIFTRGHRRAEQDAAKRKRGKAKPPIPATLEIALCETIASEAVARLGACKTNAKALRKALLTYLDPAAHDKATEGIFPFNADTTPKFYEVGTVGTLRANQGGMQGGNGIGYCVHDGRGRGDGNTVATICTDHDSRPGDQCNLLTHFDRQSNSSYGDGQYASTVAARDHKGPTDLIVALDSFAESGRGVWNHGEVATLRASGGYSSGGSESLLCLRSSAPFPDPEVDLEALSDRELATLAQATVAKLGRRYIVRRLTPWECLALQGFPADHCTVNFGKGGKVRDIEAAVAFHAAEGTGIDARNIRTTLADSHIYRAAGNSMSVDNVKRIMGAAEYEGGAYMRKPGRSAWVDTGYDAIPRCRHKARMLGIGLLDLLEMMRDADDRLFDGNGEIAAVWSEVERELDSRFYCTIVHK